MLSKQKLFLGARRIFPLGIIAFCLAFLFACHSDKTEDAAEKARSFALDHLKGITEMQRNYIRYTQPQIFENRIFTKYAMPISDPGHLKQNDFKSFPTAPDMDLMHSCFVWEPPDLGAMVLVIGSGERSMRDWKPMVVQIKKFSTDDSSMNTAMKNASDFVISNYPLLTTAEQNRVRFSTPEMRYTKFKSAESEDLAAASDNWEAYLEELKTKKVLVQLSLTWPGDNNAERIVVTGMSASGNLNGWTPQNAELMKNEKLERYTMSQEEIAALPVKPPPPPKLIFPPEPQVERIKVPKEPDRFFGRSFIQR